MSDSFGARLRQQREQRQISLTTIAEQTKIKMSLLEGLERDDISQWPIGIFRRAFVRSYATAVGLDANAVVQEFLAINPDVDVLPPESMELLATNGLARAKPPTRFQFLVSSAMSRSFSLGREAAPDKRAAPPVPARAVDAPAAFVTPFQSATSTVDSVPSTIEPIEPESVLAVEPETASTSVQPDTTSAEPTGAPSAVEPEASIEPEAARIESAPVAALPCFEPDLAAAARLCTALARATINSEIAPLLPEAARLLDAAGLIVWAADPQAIELRPMLAHGYPDRLVAQLPAVRRDADNATGAAFRSGEICVVSGGGNGRGAIVVPLMTTEGCAGVLAAEVLNRSEQSTSLHALATIIGAQLAHSIRAAQWALGFDRRRA